MKVLVAISCKKNYKELFENAINGRAELVYISADDMEEERRQRKLRSSKDKDMWKNWLADADVIIGNPPVSELAAAKCLKWLQAISAGVEGYVESKDFPKDALLTNATGAFGGIISEYVLAGILTLYRKFTVYKDFQRQHLWKDAGSELQLMGKHALILGAGDIGVQVARRLKAFDVNVTGVRRVVREKPDEFDRMVTLDDLDEVLPSADIVVGCLPKTKETIHILNEKRLRSMKKDALLANVGRGSLIDTEALVTVLQEGHLMGAVLDVTEPEPLPADHPLWDIERVLLTPHISGKSFDHADVVEELIMTICCDNLKRFLDGKELRNRVNFESGYAEISGRGVEK